MKSKFELVLLGIILQSIDFVLDFGFFKLNATSAVAFALIIIGLLPYKNEQNRLFGKCLKSTIRIAVIFVVSVIASVLNFAAFNESISMLFFAIISVLYMYMTYYLTESVVLQAKMIAKKDIAKSLKSTWTMLGVGIIGYYFVMSMKLGVLVLIVHIAYILAALYYGMIVRNLWNQIYDEKGAE